METRIMYACLSQGAISVFSLIFVLINKCLAESCASHNLLLVSFDGFRWNYLNRTNTPNFDVFLKNGVHSKLGLKNAFITKTFPNHNTLATGLWEESHGIVANKMYDPNLKEVFTLANKADQSSAKWFDNGGEPIWVTNQLQNSEHRSGTYMWPGGTAPVKDVTATKHVIFDRTVKNETRVDNMVKWFTSNYPINLGLLYFEEPDEFGHMYGPESEQVTRMIGGLDKLVGYLLKKLEETDLLSKTNIIITSDHGFAESPPDKIINLDKFIDPFSYRIFATNPVANILPNEGKEEELYKNLSKASTEEGHFKVYLKEDIPDSYHYKHNDRIMPILIVAEEHYQLVSNESGTSEGEHGWDNKLQDMHPFFLAMGPSFKKGASVELLHNVDIYPLMCHLLCLKPAPNNGTLQSALPLLKNGFSSDDEIWHSTSVTFGTYMCIVILVALVASVFTVATCQHHRYLKNQQGKKQFGLEGLQYSSPDDAKSPLLDSEDEVP